VCGCRCVWRSGVGVGVCGGVWAGFDSLRKLSNHMISSIIILF
jgi:hypothetical protein